MYLHLSVSILIIINCFYNTTNVFVPIKHLKLEKFPLYYVADDKTYNVYAHA